MNYKNETNFKTYFVVWLGLMVLLALTVTSAIAPIGGFHMLASLIISVAKMMLVMLFFMHIRTSGKLIGVISFAAFFWIALLIGLTLMDFLTRPDVLAPWWAF